MAGELLLDRPADGVLRLTISNPAKRNALDHAILDAIATAMDDLGDARAVLLTGADGMFSSGYDIGDIADDVFAEEAERLVAHPFADALEALYGCDIPTVAALPGHTIGGGLELAQDLAANAPLSMRGNKRVLRELLAAESALDPDIERELVELREASFHSDDLREGVRAFGEKRPARW